jgi:hypothetical protein
MGVRVKKVKSRGIEKKENNFFMINTLIFLKLAIFTLNMRQICSKDKKKDRKQYKKYVYGLQMSDQPEIEKRLEKGI